LSAAKRPNLPPPVLVEDGAGLQQLIQTLRKSDLIAVDTEADSFYRYRESVCLIQITVDEQDFLIDPLARLDIAPLGEIFADASKTKVFHDGEYDVLILKGDFDFRFAGLFDTRIAAAALGFESPGLASVVKERFGVELDKSQQRSNWSKRPLTESQIAYAREDTRYLIPLMHQLQDELEERGRAVIVEGECRRLESLEPMARTFNPDDFIRLKGARALSPHQMSALRELFILRDDMARARDVPPFKVLGNHALVAIAEARPRSMRRLEQVDGLSPKVAKRLGSALLDAVRGAEEKGPIRSAPRPPNRDGTSHLSEVQVELHDRLKTWRKDRAKSEGIDSSLVLNRHALVRLAETRPGDLDALAGVEGVLAWQVDLFGRELLDVVGRFERDLAAGRISPKARRRRRSGGGG